MIDTLEVFDQKGRCMVSVKTSFAPMVGEIISILGKSWVVEQRSFAVDYSDRPNEARVCCAVMVKQK